MATSTTHKTVRRDVIRRLVDSGRLFVSESYSFDDMHGESRTENRAIPVRMMPADRRTTEGVCYMFESDFKSGSGAAWRNADGTINPLYSQQPQSNPYGTARSQMSLCPKHLHVLVAGCEQCARRTDSLYKSDAHRLQTIRDFYTDRSHGDMMFLVGVIDVLLATLRAADVAINPPDQGGISLHEWNKRLKEATAQIRSVMANTERPNA